MKTFYADSPYLALGEQLDNFDLSQWATLENGLPKNSELKAELQTQVKKIAELQRKLYADDRFSLLLVFQAMDAAGKDSTIRHVFSGVNPAGFQVHSFKQPSKKELDHDYLWRTNLCHPEKGRIGVFNRSHYEEVLVVRVHPEYLSGQRLHDVNDLDALWDERFESIRNSEKHLAHNGTVVLKFFLNVSREEQARRFLSRLERPEKRWKFSDGDLSESALWPKYMHAYEQAIQHTSTELAPWYVIPADNKPFMRLQVASIILQTLENLPLEYPSLKASNDEIEQWTQDLKNFLAD